MWKTYRRRCEPLSDAGFGTRKMEVSIGMIGIFYRGAGLYSERRRSSGSGDRTLLHALRF
jgi:hypothetical protein